MKLLSNTWLKSESFCFALWATCAKVDLSSTSVPWGFYMIYKTEPFSINLKSLQHMFSRRYCGIAPVQLKMTGIPIENSFHCNSSFEPRLNMEKVPARAIYKPHAATLTFNLVISAYSHYYRRTLIANFTRPALYFLSFGSAISRATFRESNSMID
jgi:hypothetical protein